jgi:hypothetical protein
MSDLRIIRVKKEERYFVASNEPFNDERLSWEARGVMGYLLSKPDDWIVRNTDLIKQGPANEHKIKRILRELKKYGYLHRYNFRNDKGQIVWVTEIYESPSLNPSIGRFSTDGSSTDGSSTNGKSPHIIKTDLPNTDLLNTDKEGGANAPALSVNKKSQKNSEVHLAITTFYEVAGHWPPKAVWKLISETVGHEADPLAFWGQVIQAWIGCGWSPKNVAGMLDYFKRGELPTTGHKKEKYGNHGRDRKEFGDWKDTRSLQQKAIAESFRKS